MEAGGGYGQSAEGIDNRLGHGPYKEDKNAEQPGSKENPCPFCMLRLQRKLLWGFFRFIHTYARNENPLPTFEGEPTWVSLEDTDIDVFTDKIWESLDADNKISLFVRFIDIETGKYETRIVNKNK